MLMVNDSTEAFSDIPEDTIPGISFNQVDFILGRGTHENTDWGEIVVNIKTVKRATGIESGYVNGYTDSGWVIENLIIIKDFPYETVSTYFDLGKSGQVREIDIHIEVTTDPFLKFSGSERASYPVGDVVYNAEGAGSKILTFDPPDPPLAGEMGDNYLELGEKYEVAQPDHPNVQSSKMQCVPVAYANSLQYLENRYGMPVGDDLEWGCYSYVTGHTPEETLVTRFDSLMDRPAFNYYIGEGTGYKDGLEGFLKYTSLPPLSWIDVKHQGEYGDEDVYGFFDRKSEGQGTDIDFEFLLESMEQGHAVYLAFGRYDENDDRYGGHAVQLVAAGYVFGVPFITMADDGTQAHVSEDPFFTEGLRTPTRYLEDSDDDGMYNLLKSPLTCEETPPEVEMIVTMEAFNTPPNTPSVPDGPFTIGIDFDYEFSTSTTDPDGDPVDYLWDWGEGITLLSWDGSYPSGATAEASHQWNTDGIYWVRAKARDMWGAESDWSPKHYVTVEPYNTGCVSDSSTILKVNKIGDDKIDKKLDAAIGHIDSALDPDLWIDGDRLDPQHGHRVFSEAKAAVQKLGELRKHKDLPDPVGAACDSVAGILASVSLNLANQAFDDASAGRQTKQSAHQLAMAERDLTAAQELFDGADYAHAIDLLRSAHNHAENAVR
jgi:hypothetical protein